MIDSVRSIVRPLWSQGSEGGASPGGEPFRPEPGRRTPFDDAIDRAVQHGPRELHSQPDRDDTIHLPDDGETQEWWERIMNDGPIVLGPSDDGTIEEQLGFLADDKPAPMDTDGLFEVGPSDESLPPASNGVVIESHDDDGEPVDLDYGGIFTPDPDRF